MRKTVYAVLGAALFLSMGSAVLADAPDPGVPQPFGVYCDPYLSAFTEGGYYVPTDGGSCTYSFGNFASSTVVMATYKGVPGDSVPVGQFNNSTAANSQYVFITSPNNFLSLDIPPVAGDDLFSVVYAVDTGAQFFAAHGYFTTGSDAPPPNLQIIHWKWGVPLTTTADSFTITYGDAIPTLTYSFSGFAGSDNAGSNDVTGSASCTTTATASSPAGTYPITCTQGTLASITYGFPTFVPGTLTINKASLTVTADNKSMNSGSSVPALTATLSGFVNGDTSVTGGVTGSASCSTTATSASSAGTYPITCTAGTLASTKYTFDTFVAGTLTVTTPPPPTTPNCIIALNTTAKGAITLAGSSALRMTGCKTQVNSNASNAVDISGATVITSAGNCIVGAVKKSGSASVSPAPTPCSAKADPFASYPKPAVSACTYTNYTTSGAKTVTLSPGTYCGGIKFSGSSNITFAPGLYILKDGPLQTSGSTQLTGSGVSFFLTGKGAGLNFAGSTNIHLSAASTGPLPGFLFFLDPTSTTAAASSVSSGAANLYLEGVVYLPHQALSLSGSSVTTGAAHFTSYIADTFSLSGASSLSMDATHPGVPVPPGL